jgi:hypothetical protein
VITGLPIFASSVLIYKEFGWESLAERRKRRKLQMFYNHGKDILKTFSFFLSYNQVVINQI